MSFWNIGNNSNSLFGNTSSFGGMNNLLGDYASIRNGSYKKLLTEYYKKNPVDRENGKVGTNTAKSVDDNSKALKSVKTQAEALSESSAALLEKGKDSLFVEKKIKIKDEKTGEEKDGFGYDREAISKAVETFVNDYNNLVESSGKLNTRSVLQDAVFLTSNTSAYKNTLKDAGITIGKDNKLSIDKDKLGTANISSLKTLFQGSNSFANKVNRKADAITKTADASVKIAEKAEKAGIMYNNSGQANNFSANNYYNSWF